MICVQNDMWTGIAVNFKIKPETRGGTTQKMRGSGSRVGIRFKNT